MQGVVSNEQQRLAVVRFWVFMIVERFLTVIVLVGLSVAAQAEIYRWIDKNDSIHYGNFPPVLQGVYRPGYPDIQSKILPRKGQNLANKSMPDAVTHSNKDKSVMVIQGQPSAIAEAREESAKQVMQTKKIPPLISEEERLDKCGAFKAFVREYSAKLYPRCIDKSCDIYKAQLSRYRGKVRIYCQ